MGGMNPAARLQDIHQRLATYPTQDQHMEAVWAHVFELGQHYPGREDHVIACLMALRSELALVRTMLDTVGVAPALTSPAFERLREAASPTYLATPWRNHASNVLAPECMKVFEWAAWSLRGQDEAEKAVEQLNALRDELEALEAALTEADLSPYLRDFIQRQVATIRAALRLYKVQGARPVKDAVNEVMGAIAMESRQLNEAMADVPPESKGVLVKMGDAINKAAELCDSVDKVQNMAGRIWTLGHQAVPLLESVLTKLGSS